MTTQCISKLETLELAKLGETTYFGVLIAFAQELNRYANRVDGDYAEALDFFEEVDFLPNTKYFPGFIGGHCVIPNIDLMRTIASSPMLEAVLESNRRRVEELANEARMALTPDPKLNASPGEKQITIAGGDAPLTSARRQNGIGTAIESIQAAGDSDADRRGGVGPAGFADAQFSDPDPGRRGRRRRDIDRLGGPAACRATARICSARCCWSKS